MKNKILITLCILTALFALPAAAYAESDVAKVGENTYSTLAEAVKTAEGTNLAVELLEDCVLDIGSIDSDVVIKGDGTKTVSVPTQAATNDAESQGRLNVRAKLIFDNCIVNFRNEYQGGNNTWSVVMGGNGVLSFLNGSKAYFSRYGIYSAAGGEINVNSSVMQLTDMQYTCMMGESYGKLNVENSSDFTIDKAADPNGITGYEIKVDSSTFTVKNCSNQGLVKCNFTLSNGAKADISSNSTGINLYGGNALTVNDGTTLKVNNNSERAIMTQGRATTVVEVKAGGTLEVKNNGSGFAAEYDDSKYFAERSAISIGVYGWYDAQGRLLLYYNDVLNFEDGAKVEIIGNNVRGISNFGSAYIGNSTIIAENSVNGMVERGGGIYNAGTLVLASPSRIYNNHAHTSADDIYNEAQANVTLTEVADSLVLDDCNHAINGWYDDSENNRWAADTGKELQHIEKVSPEKYEGLMEIKAAHDLEGFSPSTGDRSFVAIYALLFAAAAFVAMASRVALKRYGK